MHHRRKELAQAIDTYEGLLAEYPDFTPARFQLGMAYYDAEQWENSIENLLSAVTTDPSNAEALNTLGSLFLRTAQYDRAESYFKQAIAADKKYAQAHFNLGFLYLLLGDYEKAWPEWEWRWQMPSFTPFQCAQPQWQGEDISDKILLVHTEQGHGDNLMYMRFLPLLRERCKKLVIVCIEPMRDIFNALDCVDEVRLGGNLPKDCFDVYLPIMSATHVLGLNLAQIPTELPYIKVPKNILVPDLHELQRQPQTLKVGMVWAGNPTFASDHHRSSGLQPMQTLCELEGAEFFALQTPLRQGDLEIMNQLGIHNLEAELTSYARTAALVEQLDLVICTCTSVAHLAAGLGKPTWIALTKVADWRWLLEREDSPWYPNVQLYRQQTEDDWSDVFARIKQDLQDKIKVHQNLPAEQTEVINS